MSFHYFLVLSLVFHIPLFAIGWKSRQSDTTSKISLELISKKTFSRENLNNLKEKKNTIPTNKTSVNSVENNNTYYKNLILFIQSKAIYPKSALSLKQEGSVITNVTISKNGKIIDFKILKSSGYNSLDSSVLRLLNKIEFYEPLPKKFGFVKIFKIPINYILK